MKILVIGGAGYIGSHVVRELLDAGHEPLVYDNLSTGKRENLFAEAGFVEGDLLDGERLASAMRGCDAAIHLAALKAAGDSMLQPEAYARNNISGAVSILNAACEAGLPRIVFSSSAAVYGEPAYLPMDEAHPTAPASFYGYTKLETERMMDWYDRLKGLRFAALRYFNAAGYDAGGRVRGLETNPGNLVPILMEAACGIRGEFQLFGDDYPTRDGTCIRDYVHVSDLARAHLLALDWLARNDKSLTVNLGSETGISVREMLEKAREITGRPIPSKAHARRPGDPATVVASSRMAGEVLGWKAERSGVDSLLATTWEQYKRAGLAR